MGQVRRCVLCLIRTRYSSLVHSDRAIVDWIPSYLQPDTQVMLRSEMEKAKTSSDVPGYIYTFEILGKGAALSHIPLLGDLLFLADLDAPTVKLKVGRAVNLVKRIDEWSKQCSSKEQVLRGWYPGVVDSEDGDGDGEVSLLKGKVRAGTKCPLCHRLERLVHLELADLAFAQAYLDPSWPDVSEPPEVSGNATSTAKNKGRTYVAPCPDCKCPILALSSTFIPYAVLDWDMVIQVANFTKRSLSSSASKRVGIRIRNGS